MQNYALSSLNKGGKRASAAHTLRVAYPPLRALPMLSETSKKNIVVERCGFRHSKRNEMQNPAIYTFVELVQAFFAQELEKLKFSVQEVFKNRLCQSQSKTRAISKKIPFMTIAGKALL